MNRREIVLLVSRAIAVLLIVPSVISFLLVVPFRIVAENLQMSAQSSVLSQPSISAFFQREGVSLAINTLSLLLHLGVATLFWKCGPWIEQILNPPENHEAARLG
jgi:hypothetical protein